MLDSHTLFIVLRWGVTAVVIALVIGYLLQVYTYLATLSFFRAKRAFFSAYIQQLTNKTPAQKGGDDENKTNTK